MKKIALFLAVLMLVFCFAACNEETDTPQTTANATAETAEETKVCDHQYTSEILRESSCEETGIVQYTCTLCSYSYTEETQPYGHEGTGASCDAPSICSRCYEVVEDAWGHMEEDGFCRECGIPMLTDGADAQEDLVTEE